ncbi:MAG: hypothetical protein ABIL06_19510 [Pseudomonadota bacterium]
MVRNIRRGHDGAFKARVALESIKGEKTLAHSFPVNLGCMPIKLVNGVSWS